MAISNAQTSIVLVLLSVKIVATELIYTLNLNTYWEEKILV